MGRNYMTGLLWAMETLAWDAEYLTRVIVILGELAARDPGGKHTHTVCLARGGHLLVVRKMRRLTAMP